MKTVAPAVLFLVPVTVLSDEPTWGVRKNVGNYSVTRWGMEL